MAPSANTSGYHSSPDDLTAIGRPLDDMSKLWIRYEATKSGDSAKNQLIEDVLTRFENIMRERQDDPGQNKECDRLRQRATMLEGSVLRLQNMLNRDPHVLLLIDGDNMIFDSNLLQQGITGGKQAAALLVDGVNTWARANVSGYPEASQVVVRVYANLRGVAEACARAGLVAHFTKVEDFARGFTCSGALVDFIDVGDATGGAQSKIEENFKLFLYNYYCWQVVLAYPNNSGYSHLLGQYKDDEETLPRVALLEGAATDNAPGDLPFRKMKIPSVFSQVKTSSVPMYPFGGQRVDSRIGLRATSEVFTPRTTPPSLKSPPIRIIGLNRNENRPPLVHTRTDSIASSADINDSTWAKVTSKNKHRPFTDTFRPQSSEPAEITIKRNRAGQRVDTVGDYDRDEVQRVKKLKGCNQHYIGVGCCHYNANRANKCPHNHHYKFTSSELKTLRVVAKETPCKKGHDCDDVNCIYGHICPFPAANVGSMRGAGCLNGEDCRFPRSMHNMDTVAVKTIRAAGAF